MPTQAPSSTTQMPPLPEGPSLDRVRGPVDISTYESWQIITVGIIACIVIGFLLWHFIRLMRYNAQDRKPLSPHEVALTKIKAAATLDDEPFAVAISAALKHYFEDGLNIPCRGRTSEEFLRSLKGNTHINGSFHESLTEFYVACDAMKFARKEATQEQRTALIASAETLIQTAEQTKEAVST